MQTRIIRTKRGVVALDQCPYNGDILRPGEDPDGVEIPDEALGVINLPEPFPKIPAEPWSRMIDLYVRCLAWTEHSRGSDETTEAGVALLRGDGTKAPRESWMIVATTQVVGGGHVQTDYTKPVVDILTGARYEGGLPALLALGWIHAGTCHSHARFQARPSATDDKSEMGQPGLHLICGNFRKVGESTGWQYDIFASIVRGGKRFESILLPNGTSGPLEWGAVVEANRWVNGALPEEVWSVVTRDFKPLSLTTGWEPKVERTGTAGIWVPDGHGRYHSPKLWEDLDEADRFALDTKDDDDGPISEMGITVLLRSIRRDIASIRKAGRKSHRQALDKMLRQLGYVKPGKE